MKNVLIIVSFLTLLWSKSVLEIHSINDESVVLKNEQSLLKIGQSGFVVSDYLDAEYISAIVSIVEISDDFVKTKVIYKNPFKKKDLAYAKKNINKEDIVIFDLFENNVFLIAPNEVEYFKIKQSMKKQFLSPELAVSKIGNFGLDKDDLQELSLEYLLGYIYIAYDNKLVKIDAFSMEILDEKKIKLDSENEDKMFFYHSISSSSSFFINTLTAFDYDRHYKKLLQE